MNITILCKYYGIP